MPFHRLGIPIALLSCVSSAWAQDVASGPTKGEKVPRLEVFAATGPQKDKALDYAAERGEKPTIYVFIQADKWSRPMARFLKELDKAIKADDPEAYVVAVWLTDTVDQTKDYLPRAQQSIQLEVTALTCFSGPKK